MRGVRIEEGHKRRSAGDDRPSLGIVRGHRQPWNGWGAMEDLRGLNRMVSAYRSGGSME